MQQGTGKCEIEFETKLWQETGRPFVSQALSKEEQALEAQILRSRIYSDLV